MSEFPTGLGIQIAAVASAWVAAVVAIIQSRRTRQQMDSTMRPWVGLDSRGLNISALGGITGHFRNHGSIPAKAVKIWHGVQTQPFTKEQLKTIDMSKVETEAQAVIFPESERSSTWQIQNFFRPIDGNEVHGGVVDISKTWYIGVIVEYEYANKKKGNYVMTAHYNAGSKEQALDFEDVDSWHPS